MLQICGFLQELTRARGFGGWCWCTAGRLLHILRQYVNYEKFYQFSNSYICCSLKQRKCFRCWIKKREMGFAGRCPEGVHEEFALSPCFSNYRGRLCSFKLTISQCKHSGISPSTGEEGDTQITHTHTHSHHQGFLEAGNRPGPIRFTDRVTDI